MEKKKSNRKFQTSTANGHMEEFNGSQNDIQSQKKKKKKKKENDEERDYSIYQQSSFSVEETLGKKKKNKREQQEVEENPRKKKKSSKDDENTGRQTSSQGVEETVIDENWWPPEERTAMLDAMKTQIPVTGRFTRMGYLTHLRKTNWEDVLVAINTRIPGNSRTVKQCQDQFHRLLNKVGTIKSLNQILDEALTLASDLGALRREVTQARHRFIKDYMFRHKGSKDCNIMVATRVWTSLPANEKEKWEEEYQNELRQKGLLDTTVKSKKMKGPENSKSPSELYQEAKASRGEELSSTDAKAKYVSLPLKKKIPFIVESLKQQKIYEAKAAKHLEKNPTWKKVKAHGPTIKEMRDYLESLGLPLAPPNHVLGMYYMEEKEKFTDEDENDSAKLHNLVDSLKPYQRAREAFSKLPLIQQNQYKSEWRKSWIEYLSEVEKWKPMVEEKYPDILEQSLAALAEVKIPKSVTESSEKKETVRKKPSDPFSHIERQISSLSTNVKFASEPSLPARTGYELFQHKFKRDAGPNYDPVKAKEFWGRLSEDKKAVYSDRISMLKQRSRHQFLTYAANLELPQRKLYVGVKRDKLIKYFQEDIFEEDYPGEDYPILIAPPKKDGTFQVGKDMDLSEDDMQPMKSSSRSKKGGVRALDASMQEDVIKEESSEEESDDDDDNNDDDNNDNDDNEDEEGSEEQEERDSSSSDSESSDSDSDSEVEASQPTHVSPFSVNKSNAESSQLLKNGASSPFSSKLQPPSNEESSDSEDDSEEDSDSDDNDNEETPVSSRAQSINNQVMAKSTPDVPVPQEMSSDSESSSQSSDSDEDEDTQEDTEGIAVSVKKEESSDESSEEESEEDSD